MKKKFTILMFVILGMSVLSLQAGIRIGAKAGVNLANASFNTDVIQTDNFTGFQIGPILEFSTITGFGVDAAILYSQHGLKFKEPKISREYEKKVSTLDIPVNLKLKFTIADQAGVYGTAGPYISFKLDDNQISSSDIQSQWESKGFGVGLNFGAGVELLSHLQVGINYQLSLNENYSNLSVMSDLKNAKTRIWSITAAYFF